MSLSEYLLQIHKIDPTILEAYVSAWTPFNCPKKTIITDEGQTQRYMYFVLEGIQKSYYINDGKEHIIAFTYPPSFSGIPESFWTQTPSNYCLESITNSKFLRISFEKHEELMAQYRPIETLFRKGTELIAIGFVQRHYELMAYDIETRLKAFLKRSPHLLNLVPRKDLASYLRIDPTNFSKLMAKIRI